MIGARVDTRSVDRGFGAMRAAARTPDPSVLRKVLLRLRLDVRGHFDERRGIQGSWPGYAQSTRDRILGKRRGLARGGMGPHTLRELQRAGNRVNVKKSGDLSKAGKRRLGNMLGRLRSAIEWEILRAGVRGTAIPPWAWVHEFGGVNGKGQRVPQRAFMWASEAVVRYFRQNYLSHIHGAWRSAR